MNRYLHHLVEAGTGTNPEPIRPRLPTMFEAADVEPLAVIDETVARREEPSPRRPPRERPPEPLFPPDEVLPLHPLKPRRDEPAPEPVEPSPRPQPAARPLEDRPAVAAPRAEPVERAHAGDRPSPPAVHSPPEPSTATEVRPAPARPEPPPVPAVERPRPSTVDTARPDGDYGRPEPVVTPPPVPAAPTVVQVVSERTPPGPPEAPHGPGGPVPVRERADPHRLDQLSARTPERRVQISIGRVEVRAVFAPPEPATAVAPRDAAPLLSLDEYLKQRDGAS